MTTITSPSCWGTHFLYLSNPPAGIPVPIIPCQQLSQERHCHTIKSTKVKEQRLGPSACLGLCMLCMINQMRGLVCFRFTNLNICRKLKLFSRNDLHVYSATNLNTDSLKCESVNHIHTKYLVSVSHFAVYCLGAVHK